MSANGLKGFCLVGIRSGQMSSNNGRFRNLSMFMASHHHRAGPCTGRVRFNSSTSQPTKMSPKERAKHMEQELQQIVHKHDARHQAETKKGHLTGFLEFLGKNRSELSIIAASFFTVVLGVKMVQWKKKYELLAQELEKTQLEMDEKRAVLSAVKDSAFLADVAAKCANEMLFQLNNNQQRGAWSWTTKSKTGGNTDHNVERLATSIFPILQDDLASLIADANLSEDEKSARKFQELQAKREGNYSSDLAELAALTKQILPGDADEGQTEITQDESGQKIVKKSLFIV